MENDGEWIDISFARYIDPLYVRMDNSPLGYRLCVLLFQERLKEKNGNGRWRVIIVVTGWYPIYDMHGLPTGEKEHLVSHGIDTETDQTVVLPQVPPSECGCVYDINIGEYVL